MPRATVAIDTEKLELTTLEGGYVTLKRMSYGKWLERQEMAMKMNFVGEGKKASGEVHMMQNAVTKFEFAQCIVDHNLEDEAGNNLNFTQSTTLDILDPKVGNEIAERIRQMHEFDLPN